MLADIKATPSSSGDDSLSPRNFSRAMTNNSKSDSKQLAKHTLLATAANQNYQRCHRALENLEYYWAGAKYILTVLDQKAKGIVEPVLYTKEEEVCALETPSREPNFTSPGWRRKTSWENYFSDTQFNTPPIGTSHSQMPPNILSSSPKLPNVNVDMTNGESTTYEETGCVRFVVASKLTVYSHRLVLDWNNEFS